MKDKKHDSAAGLVSSDEEVDWEGARRLGSALSGPVAWVAARSDSLQIGLVRAQQAKPMTARRRTGIIRVVHRLAALWLLPSGLGHSEAAAEEEAAMVAPRRATVAEDRRCRFASGLPGCGWSGDNNKTSDVLRRRRQIRPCAPCIGDPALAERLKGRPRVLCRYVLSGRGPLSYSDLVPRATPLPTSKHELALNTRATPVRPPEHRAGPAAWPWA